MPTFDDLLPPLSTEEFEALKADIKANGVLFPVFVDEEGNVLDGRHRLKIDPNAPRKVIAGLTPAEKEAFVIRCNFVRRNLSPTQKEEARGKMEAIAKRLREEDEKKWTQSRVAAALGVDQSTISRWGPKETGSNMHTHNTSGSSTPTAAKPDARVKVGTAQKKAIVEKVKKGKTQKQVAADYGISTKTVSTIVKKADETHSRDEDKARKTAKLKTSLFDVRKGDFREVLADIEPGSVSLILTDPPYPKESLPLWEDLGKWAAGVLADDGLLVAYSGQMYLPDVLTLLSKHLDYWWCGAVVHKGSGNLTPLGHPVRKVVNQWKPLVIFCKRGGVGFVRDFKDLIEGVGPEKANHNWQQPVAEATELVKRFTKQGELVVDPFAGSGGFCKAASDAGRKSIGAEILDG